MRIRTVNSIILPSAHKVKVSARNSVTTVVGGGRCSPCGTCYPCPGGEDHLKRRSSSPPVPPLLGCRHCSRESISCHSGGKPWTSLCVGHLLDSLCKCRRRSNAGDARGGAPCMKITLISPFPAGEGGWGDRGQESKLKAGAAGDKEGKPPAGHQSGRANKCRAGSAPLRAPQRQG